MATRRDWPRATLGSVSRAGDPIVVWCNNYACSYRRAQGSQYRAMLSVADLVALAERYGDGVTFADFRDRLRCRHCGSADVSTIVNSVYVPPGDR